MSVGCLSSAGLQAQTFSNTENLGSISPRPNGTNGDYSACWGYTAPDGREYAILGCYTGTSIIDITDAPTLREVTFIPGAASIWREMKTYRQFAYIVTENGGELLSGLQIIDLSQLPDTARLANTYIWRDPVGGTPRSIPRAHSVSTSGNFLYLNGGNFNGIRILDLSDPADPKKAGVYNGPYIHDSHIRNDTIFGAAINSGGGIDIIDARNKANPTRIKLIQYGGSGTHNVWTSNDRNYLFSTDEVGSTTKSLKVWDIHDVQSPLKVGDFSGTKSIVHNVFVKGTLAYIAWYVDGLRVVDVTNPSVPQYVGYTDTHPLADTAIYAGAWGAFPYYPSGKVIISDIQSGLFVTRYIGDKRGIIRGRVRSAGTNLPLPDVLLHFNEPSLTRWTGTDGMYLFGYAPGTYSVLIEKPGFISRTVTVTIADRDTVTQDYLLTATGGKVAVYPGDTNNDGIVDVRDLLPIGRYFGAKGASRSNASSAWAPDSVVADWSAPNAWYADCNGDGTVNAVDVVVIIQNWEASRSQTAHATPDEKTVCDLLLAELNRQAASPATDAMRGAIIQYLGEHLGVVYRFSLEQNFPNPFNPTTSIRFTLPVAAEVRMRVYDVLGREIETLIKGSLPAGPNVVSWNASAVPTGMYIYRIEYGGRVLAKTMMVVK